MSLVTDPGKKCWPQLAPFFSLWRVQHCSYKSQLCSLTYPGLAWEQSLDCLQVSSDPSTTGLPPLVHGVKDMKYIFFSCLLFDSGLLTLLSMSDLFLFELNVLFNLKWSVLIGWVCGNISAWDESKTITTNFFFFFPVGYWTKKINYSNDFIFNISCRG